MGEHTYRKTIITLIKQILKLLFGHNEEDVETYVKKVQKKLLAEGVRQRLEDQNRTKVTNLLILIH